MGLFDTFEQTIAQAINTQVHEEMKPTFRLLDDRIVALEQGRIQPHDISEAVQCAIENSAAVDATIATAVETFVEHNLDIDSHVTNWFEFNFDADALVADAMSGFQDDLSGLSSKVEDLESRVSDGGGVGEDEVINLRNEIAGLEDVISSIRSDVDDIKQAIRGFGSAI